ncbi:hypothetical protein GLOIN_2v1782174 [Rhizophagus clarus]|uniref:Uncharacterized protein n=1 Tax=Rhizophagus clarus TaxID=94130 RepID=A0A8H3QY62_9GLOM|nr:hypothetical protein GLOIN_2v1782174 [Rhizophagus clarus]
MKENGNEKEHMIFDFVNYLQENNARWVRKDVAESFGSNFDKDALSEHISNLIPYKEAKWFNKHSFNWFKEIFIEFLDSLVSYVLYLDNQTRIMNENHTLDKSVRSIADSGITIMYDANKFRSSDVINKYETLINVLQELKYWIPLDISPKQKYAFINSAETLFGTNTVKKSILQNIYKTLTQDSTAANCENEAEVDAHVIRALQFGDPKIVIDLRELNLCRPEKYNVFWEYCQKFLDGAVKNSVDSLLAVDERRYDTIVHLAKAISVKDLRNQVATICPENTSIPHEQWIHLQFWPKNPRNNTSLQYTGHLQVKFMIQIRQLQIKHEDVHYASALFRYLKELAVILSGFYWLVFLDDKHCCKVGKPGFSVAAIDRGKSVLVLKRKVL